jgi:hypothetical protein
MGTIMVMPQHRPHNLVIISLPYYIRFALQNTSARSHTSAAFCHITIILHDDVNGYTTVINCYLHVIVLRRVHGRHTKSDFPQFPDNPAEG